MSLDTAIRRGELPPLARGAVLSASDWHAGQLRESDGAPFIEHPLEVARLLRDAGGSDAVIAAGALHDVLENTDVSEAELRARFGDEITELVRAVSDDGALSEYRPRKRELRRRVSGAALGALLIFAADKISKVRELANLAARDPLRYGPDSDDEAVRAKLEHYRSSVVVLVHHAGEHPLVRQLVAELADYDAGGSSGSAGSAKRS